MKWLVAGGRDFVDKQFLFDKLNRLAEKYSKEFHPKFNWLPTDIHVIAGGAKGADTLAVDWAVDNYAPFTEVKADWDKYGKRAGWIRNNAMADLEPDLVVLFPGGRGTQMMYDIAQKRGIEIVDYRNG